jgi:hypothetical protein
MFETDSGVEGEGLTEATSEPFGEGTDDGSGVIAVGAVVEMGLLSTDHTAAIIKPTPITHSFLLVPILDTWLIRSAIYGHFSEVVLAP